MRFRTDWKIVVSIIICSYFLIVLILITYSRFLNDWQVGCTTCSFANTIIGISLMILLLINNLVYHFILWATLIISWQRMSIVSVCVWMTIFWHYSIVTLFPISFCLMKYSTTTKSIAWSFTITIVCIYCWICTIMIHIIRLSSWSL